MRVEVMISGEFTAEEAIERLTSSLVGRGYLSTEDRGRIFGGSIRIVIVERSQTAEAEQAEEALRVRSLPESPLDSGKLP